MGWLETAVPLRDPGLAEAAVDPMLDPIRDAARFRVVQTQLGEAASC